MNETIAAARALADPQKSPVTNNRLVYERFRAGILSGRVLPGAKISIVALAEEMEVSVGAVREALAKLEADELVIAESQRGYRVTPVSPKDLRQLVEARIEIEKLCLAQAIEHGDLAWEGSIVAALHRLNRQHERDVADKNHLSPAWTVAHAEYHQAIIAGCPNDWLRRVHSMLYHQSERYRQLSAPLAVVKRDVPGEHKALLNAVLQRDVALAQQLITRHLRTTADLILNSPFLAREAEQVAGEASGGSRSKNLHPKRLQEHLAPAAPKYSRTRPSAGPKRARKTKLATV